MSEGEKIQKELAISMLVHGTLPSPPIRCKVDALSLSPLVKVPPSPVSRPCLSQSSTKWSRMRFGFLSGGWEKTLALVVAFWEREGGRVWSMAMQPSWGRITQCGTARARNSSPLQNRRPADRQPSGYREREGRGFGPNGLRGVGKNVSYLLQREKGNARDIRLTKKKVRRFPLST
ncbi:hypothetical protein LZ31DRAFT_53809 [Colletotrichum somersetense]|nr:hypothetical protein LZ31DRAFT_53809 [Colletotrichum somersetense]